MARHHEHAGGVEDSGGEAGESWLVASILPGMRPALRLRHSAPAERSRARMRRSRPVVDSAQARRSGQKPTDATRLTWPNCTERVNRRRRCGFQITAHEAIRAIWCARLAAVRVLRQARQQLSGFLLRHGHHYNRPAWTLLHRRWLAGLSFEHVAHYIVLGKIASRPSRRRRLGGIILKPTSKPRSPDWSLTRQW